jgi:CelD/BcsL family acetyltransferase involved in cellulose biosynthesis
MLTFQSKECKQARRELGFRLEVYQGRSGLDALAAGWRTLFEALPQPSYAQLWDWQRAHLEGHAADPDNVHFGALYDGGTVIAIVPLEFKVTRIFGRLRVHVANLPWPDRGYHCDILVHPQALQRFDLMRMLEAFRASVRRPWEITRLGPVLEDSTASAVFHNPATQAPWPQAVRLTAAWGYSDALESGNYEAVLGKLSSNLRSNLRRLRNKLVKLGDRHIEWACTPEALEAALPPFLEVEASGWKGTSGSGTAIALNPAYQKFWTEFALSLAPSGKSKIILMRHGEKVIGGQFYAVVGERYYQLKIGYDEAYHQEAPGHLLLDRALQEAAHDPAIRYVDLVSDAAWHQSWRPIRRRVLAHYVFHNLPLGMAAWAAHRGKEALPPLLRGLKRRVGALAAGVRPASASKAP